jgi:Transposase IS116/IS110/IS902 family
MLPTPKPGSIFSNTLRSFRVCPSFWAQSFSPSFGPGLQKSGQVRSPVFRGLTSCPLYRGRLITKQGRKELRRVLVEAAWIAVRYDPYWHQLFEALAFRLGREKAIVAIARKLLVVIWHVLSAKVADRQAQPQQVARFFIRWGRQLRVKSTLGIKASQFARQMLDRVALGQELVRVPYGCVTYCLPPSTQAQPSVEPATAQP